jgi:putative peptidoglycan lipid II flippase
VLEILARTFYAMHDTKTPVLIGAAAMGLNVVFSFAFSALFTKIGWMPHGGLALANSLATALEAITLFILMRKRLNGIHGVDVAKGFGAAALGTVGLSAALVAWMQFRGSGSAALTAIGGIVIGGAVYAAIIVLLRVPEVKSLVGFVTRQLKKVR